MGVEQGEGGVRVDIVNRVAKEGIFTERVKRFQEWVTEFDETGRLPRKEKLRASEANFGACRRVYQWPRKEDFPREPEEQLGALERMMVGRDIRAAKLSASTRRSDLDWLRELAGLRDLQVIIMTSKEFYQGQGQDWGQVVREGELVTFKGGWTSSGSVWEDLPRNIIERKGETVCLIFSAIPFGISDFAPGQWEFAKQAEIITHESIRFLYALWERALGVRQRKAVEIAHSFMGAEILQRPEHELGRRGRSHIALAPALISRFGFGDYSALGLSAALAGGLPGVFNPAIQRVINKLIKHLVGEADWRIKKTHEAVMALALQRGDLNQSPAHAIDYLARDQGRIKKKQLLERTRVVIAGGDPLVDPVMLEELYEAGITPEQVESCFFSGHYTWAETNAKKESRRIAAQGVRRRVLDWVREFSS